MACASVNLFVVLTSAATAAKQVNTLRSRGCCELVTMRWLETKNIITLNASQIECQPFGVQCLPRDSHRPHEKRYFRTGKKFVFAIKLCNAIPPSHATFHSEFHIVKKYFFCLKPVQVHGVAKFNISHFYFARIYYIFSDAIHGCNFIKNE